MKKKLFAVMSIIVIVLCTNFISFAGVNNDNITCMIFADESYAVSPQAEMPINKMQGTTNSVSNGYIHFYAQGRYNPNGVLCEAGDMIAVIGTTNYTNVDTYYNFYRIKLEAQSTFWGHKECVGWGKIYEE